MEYFEHSIETKIESLKFEFDNREIELIEKIEEFEKKLCQKHDYEFSSKAKPVKESRDCIIAINGDYLKIERQKIGILCGLSFPTDKRTYQNSDKQFLNLCKNLFI